MASTRDWFETVAEAQRRAKRRLPRSVYLAVVAGTEAGVTMHDNVRAFSELRLRPHVAGLPADPGPPGFQGHAAARPSGRGPARLSGPLVPQRLPARPGRAQLRRA